MSKVRAEILTYLTRESVGREEVSARNISDHFLELCGMDEEALNSALDDLRHFGLIQIGPGGIKLALLGRRLSS